MREIKFRAVYDGILYNFVELTSYKDGSLGVSIGTGHHDLFTPKHDDKLQILQFIGIQDKNRIDIYQGDILMSVPFTGSYHPNKQIVDFYGMSFVFRGITKNASPHTDYTIGTITNENMKQDDAVEIIGNIYENPELLI